jgi:hypothetical protein
MFIPDPEFYPTRTLDTGSRIPDAKHQKRGGKLVVLPPCYLAAFHKIEIFFTVEPIDKEL